jgi:hypothetical protein
MMSFGVLLSKKIYPKTKQFTVFYQVFYIENDAEIFPAHYTWKVPEKVFKMNKHAIIISFEIILEKQK